MAVPVFNHVLYKKPIEPSRTIVYFHSRMLRVLLPILILFVCCFAFAQDEDNDCNKDLTVELAFDIGARESVSAIAVPHYIARHQRATVPILDKPTIFNIPILKGFRNTDIAVKRFGRELGKLGKTNRNRFALLEPFKGTPPELRTLYCMMKLAKAGVAVPVLGITTIKGEQFIVRPLIKGYAPMALWGSLYNNSSFNQILELEKMEKVLLETYPGYVRWGLVKDSTWMTRSSDIEFDNEKIDMPFSLYLNEFLEQIKFVATEDGRLLIEKLPPLVSNYSPDLPLIYPVVQSEDGTSWRFQRWNWYRYMIAAQLAQNERPKFETWLKDKERVEWLMRFQFLNRLVRNSPFFPGPRNRMTGPPFGMTEDKATPFARPTDLKFKKNSALNYHFKKHGALMNYADEAAYLQGAKDFISAPPLDDRLYYTRQSGDIVLAERDGSRMAVFSPDGQIRTYMQPSVEFHGHNHNNYYFYEQILKDLDFL